VEPRICLDDVKKRVKVTIIVNSIPRRVECNTGKWGAQYLKGNVGTGEWVGINPWDFFRSLSVCNKAVAEPQKTSADVG
jgi:hypothetical protein